MPKPRFTLYIQSPGGIERIIRMFYTLTGLEQWLANARATGEVGEQDKVSVYDDSGVKL